MTTRYAAHSLRRLVEARFASGSATAQLHHVPGHDLAVHHPNCPAEVVDGIATYIAGRCWKPPVTIGGAVGIAAAVYVRHRLTDYDHLLRRHRLTREEARLVVAPEIASIIRSWKGDPAELATGP